ncbi:SRPBCC family protein [Dietzia sp. SLG310A2-38A2]|uniref:SRPBCC family protein n=1 Tax=Dietzia sp. SLG310A2-38A2 TaxID=1630643 RepID=UPI0015FD3ADA|nr:SRPBCC family protein [Dietzia sp. SLG310A2-38A2]MBB1032521.1 SRPBCC family protein [Dietzia sp. SLG310A2-38A2]
MSTTRELRAEVEVDAPVERVWEVVTDTYVLVRSSPELVAMTPLLPGGFRKGQQYIGWNRRKLVAWPTRNVVIEFEPNKRVAWDTKTSGARWAFELQPTQTGTRLVQRRSVPGKLNPIGQIFAAMLLGGGPNHADELETALGTTLESIKAIAEA